MEQKIEQSTREELYLKYILPEQGFIYRNCCRYSSSKEETRNYYSEVIERVFMYIETYNPLFHIRPWLSVIIQRIIFDRKQAEAVILHAEQYQIDNLISSDSISERCLDIDRYEDFYSDDIVKAIKKMNPVRRKAVLMQQAGYKVMEIAAKLFEDGSIKTPDLNVTKRHLREGKM